MSDSSQTHVCAADARAAGRASPSPASTVRSSAWRSQWKTLVVGVLLFVTIFALPIGRPRFDQSLYEALALARWYAQEHVLLCLIPAFFIAGAIAVFIRQAAVMRYLGPTAPKPVAYGVASVSGTILAVCSCTVLPLFAGIWRMGAGLGPATAFLYSGPAINVLAIVLTAAVLGPRLGAARAVGAIVFSVVIGLAMHFIYRREEAAGSRRPAVMPDEDDGRPLGQTAAYFAAMVGILVFANWGRPQTTDGIWFAVWSAKWVVTSFFAAVLGIILTAWFGIRWWKIALTALAAALAWALARWWIVPVFGPSLPAYDRGLPYEAMIPFLAATIGLTMALSIGARDEEANAWFEQTWGFAKQITPLLLFGVLIAGFLLGRPGEEGMIPSRWIASLVGGNTLPATFFASVVGAFMYFATLTEVPILQGLIGNGMGQGPSLALLLAGPALSLPNMLVIRSIMGTQKTIVFVALVVVMSTVTGWLYGIWF